MAKKKAEKSMKHVKGGPAGQSTAMNMFERLWNRRKFSILGKKVKGEQRKIGQARTEGLERRKKTLLEEYKGAGKSNQFLDHRFGERDESLLEEDKAILRFQRERQRQLSKKSKFTLNDEDSDGGGAEGEEEILTHGGTALSALDDFEDDALGDDDNDNPELDAEMVGSFHFGGGGREEGQRADGEEEDEPERRKTKKEVMEEIILKSKQGKAQRAREKEQDEDLRGKLDEAFKELSQGPLLASLVRPPKSERKEDPAEKGKGAVDDFDRMTRELIFEARAQASDRLKTPEEAAKEELERLEKLEKKRRRRMEGKEDLDASSDEEDEETDEGGGGWQARRKRKKRAEVSGDDLGENFALDEDEDDEPKRGWVDEVMARKGEDEGDEESEDEEGSGEEEDEDEDGEDEDEGSDEETGEEEEEEDDEMDDAAGPGIRAAADEWEESDEDVADVAKSARADVDSRGPGRAVVKAKGKGGPVVAGAKRGVVEEAGGKTKEIEAEDLPFVIHAPQTIEELKKFVDGQPVERLVEALRRIRACNAISLAAENRRKMQVFYNVLLQYFSLVASGSSPLDMERIDAMTRPLIEMSAATPVFAALCARQRIVHLQQQLSKKLRDPDGSSCWPTVRTLLLLRLWSLIFPPSDFRHPVMTPVMLLSCEYLSRCPVASGRDIAVGTFLCSHLLSVMSQGRRFCPEALSFLHALLLSALATKNSPNGASDGNGAPESPWGKVPLFVREQFGERAWLRLSAPTKSAEPKPLDFVDVMGRAPDDPFFESDTFKGGVLAAALGCLEGFARLYSSALPSFPEVFSPLLSATTALCPPAIPTALPKWLEEKRHQTATAIQEGITKALGERQPLRMRNKRPTPMKQFNPKFEENFALGRDYDPDRERAERKKLTKLLKREAKGAARELRKDNYFIAEQKMREREEAEEERSENYKRAMSFLQEQEGGMKSGQLGKKRRKRRN